MIDMAVVLSIPSPFPEVQNTYKNKHCSHSVIAESPKNSTEKRTPNPWMEESMLWYFLNCFSWDLFEVINHPNLSCPNNLIRIVLR